MSIRPAAAADIPVLAALENACNPAPWSAGQLQAALNPPNQLWLRTDAQGEITAMLAWQQLIDEAEIHLLNTAPAQRRQGHAQALLNALFQVAPAHGIQRILLEVRAGNAAAQALYRRNGFIECGRRKGYYGGVEDAVLMEKTC